MAQRKEQKIRKSSEDRPHCGLCGKTFKLTKTECRNRWICDDEDKYVIFSYARNSCHRNHDRYTLCSSHHHEGHKGDWKTCQECRKSFSKSFEIEMYVWYGTNEYNFEKLPNPPPYKPTKCGKCKKIINLGEDGYSQSGKQYLCLKCEGFE